jgi:hypothetical protein
MSFRRGFDIVFGLIAVGRPFQQGVQTRRLDNSAPLEHARIPRWVAGAFYFVLGLFLLYIGITGK